MEFLKDALDIYNDDEIIICQDKNFLSKSEFISKCTKAKNNAYKKFKNIKNVYLVSDNSLDGLVSVIGLVAAGINVLPLNIFNNGYLNDYLISQFDDIVLVTVEDLLEDCDNFECSGILGGIYTYSAGTTGFPHISLTDAFGFNKKDIDRQREMIFSKMNVSGPVKIFYSAPLMSGATVYICMLIRGLKTYLTNNIPTTSTIQNILDENNINACTGRPSIIERFMQEDQKLNGIKTFISAGAPLKTEHLDFIESLGAERIVDFYSTTEAGLIAVREALTEKEFDIYPGVEFHNITDKSFMVSSGFLYNQDLIEIDDRVIIKNNQIATLERPVKKIKSNGFSVSTNVVKTAVKDYPGVVDVKVSGCRFEEKDSVRIDYTGEKIDENNLKKFLSQRLPFYSVPRIINFVENADWGVGK